MAKRIFSTVLLWAIVAGALWYFRTTGAVMLIGVISILSLREFYQLLTGAGLAPFDRLGMALGGLITLAPWLEQRFGLNAHHVLALAVIIFSLRIIGERPADKRVEALASTIFGLVYIALLLQYLVRIVISNPAAPNQGLLLFLWLVAVAKFCDVGALLTGLAIGRHKMSPDISPKKTWEGAFGGVVVSMGVGALIAWLARDQLPANLTPLHAAMIAAPIAMTAIVSDLVESILKRRAAIKDSGGIIPGIGGMFDVSDSLILTAPLGFFLLNLV
ncbi:MAG: phosphatidate cytidylyltransferase [Cephaloticoccus sp.]|nr:phosphatidate cytidylyltransferase [Cephaloticoccus sp.]MCF7760055.1 phosphatidate cytidylyltransferase [Cephaloticoccus sp.]